MFKKDVKAIEFNKVTHSNRSILGIIISGLLLATTPVMAQRHHQKHHHKTAHKTHHREHRKTTSHHTTVKHSNKKTIKPTQKTDLSASIHSNTLKPVIPKVAELQTSQNNASSLDVDISKQITALSNIAPNLSQKVLRLALIAYIKARHDGLDQQEILTVVDYSMPDTSKRLWAFNLKNDTLLFNTLVAHGKNSGDVEATKFSNKPNTKESSLGLFLTLQTYSGHHGYSLRVKGLSKGFNDNADSRAVVMHSAWYVSEKFVKENHRLGRSWGCFALSKKIATPLIKTIKDGSLIFAYANNANWLNHSTYLNS